MPLEQTLAIQAEPLHKLGGCVFCRLASWCENARHPRVRHHFCRSFSERCNPAAAAAEIGVAVENVLPRRQRGVYALCLPRLTVCSSRGWNSETAASTLRVKCRSIEDEPLPRDVDRDVIRAYCSGLALQCSKLRT